MRSVSSNSLRLPGLAVVCAVLAGCTTYGSFDEHEPGLEESLLGPIVSIAGAGISQEDEPIDYSARAPLVAPPETAALPAPQAGEIAAQDPNWPTGSQERMAQVLASEDQTLVFTPGIDGVDVAATEALRERSSQPAVNAGEPVNRVLLPQELERERQIELARSEAQAAREEEIAVSGRRYLTDPPVSARVPSPDAPYGEDLEEEEDADEGGFTLWPF